MRSIFTTLLAGLLLACLALATRFACAQDTDKPDAAEAEGAPDLGDIMVQQQMRHIKLWFAGDAGNWPLADYELDKLKDGFDEIAKLLGGDFAQQHVGGAVSQLQRAVDGKNREAFVSAFDRLNAGCNECHRSLDHAFIVIQRPVLLPYSDQNFSPRP